MSLKTTNSNCAYKMLKHMTWQHTALRAAKSIWPTSKAQSEQFGQKLYDKSQIYHRGFALVSECHPEVAGVMTSLLVQCREYSLGLPFKPLPISTLLIT